MVVAVLAYGIPPALPRLLIFSCRVHCLYLLLCFFHGAGLGSLLAAAVVGRQSVEFQGSVVRWALTGATYWYR
jgi:hypothetical protein